LATATIGRRCVNDAISEYVVKFNAMDVFPLRFALLFSKSRYRDNVFLFYVVAFIFVFSY